MYFLRKETSKKTNLKALLNPHQQSGFQYIERRNLLWKEISFHGWAQLIEIQISLLKRKLESAIPFKGSCNFGVHCEGENESRSHDEIS